MSVNAVDSIGYNPYSYANDQAFWNAYNSYNVNFKGTQGATGTQATVSSTASTDSASTAVSNLPKADYSESSSSKGLVAGAIATGLGVATLIYASKRGKGKGIMAGFKNIWNGFKGSASKAADDVADAAADATKDKLNKLKIIYEKGKPKFYVPGKTETITNTTEITNFLKKNKSLTSIRTKTGQTTILDGTFELVDGGIKNIVTFKDGKITGLNNGTNDILNTFFKDGQIIDNLDPTNQAFAEKVLEQISKVQKGNLTPAELKGLTNIRYQTQIGDNLIEATRGAINSKPTYTKLTRLKALNENSDEVLAYIRDLREKGIDISAITQKDFITKNKLPNGFKVGEFTFDFGAGKKILVLDGKPVAMIEGGNTYDLSTTKFKAFLEKTTSDKNNEKLITEYIEKALKDNKIPEGATIVQV